MFIDLMVTLDDGSVESFSSACSLIEFLEENEYCDNKLTGIDVEGEPWDVSLGIIYKLADEEFESAQRAMAERKAINELSTKTTGGSG